MTARPFPALGETVVLPTWTIVTDDGSFTGNWVIERRAVTRDDKGLHDRPVILAAAGQPEHRSNRT